MLADDGVVTAGQSVTVTAQVANYGETAVAVRQISFDGFASANLTCGTDVVVAGAVYTCESAMRLPETLARTDIHWERLPDSARYRLDPDVPFGLPFRPTPFRATFELDFISDRIAIERPIVHRHGSDLFAGEKRMELQVVPRFAVEVTPQIAIIPARCARCPRSARDGSKRRSRAGDRYRRAGCLGGTRASTTMTTPSIASAHGSVTALPTPSPGAITRCSSS